MMLHADNSRDEKARHLITLWLMHSRMRGEREVEREGGGERERVGTLSLVNHKGFYPG